MSLAQLLIRCRSPDGFAISFVPPDPVAPAWLPTYPVHLAQADLDDLATAVDRAAGSFLAAASQPVPETLASLGRLLARHFLPESIRQALTDLPPDVPLLIATDAPAYPWELMHPGDELLFLRRPVGRQRLGPHTPAKPALAPPSEPAMLLIANPGGDLEAGDVEASRILGILDALPQYVRCTAIFRQQATRAAVQAELATGIYSLVHYTGHAEPGDAPFAIHSLRLADGPFTPGQLAAALTGEPLVFLNACASARSEPHADDDLVTALLQAGVRACIGTFWPVSDPASAELSAAFYQALFRGRPVGEALWQARRAVRAVRPDDSTWAAFVLYGDPTWQPVPRPSSTTHLATVLIGRAEDMTGQEPAQRDAGVWIERLETLAEVLIRFGGRIWQWGPAGLLATFGIPDPQEDQAQRAARAALALLAAAQEVGLALAIGLETGSTMVYTADAPISRDLLVGPAVEQALYLSRRAGANQVRVGPGAYRLLEATCEWSPHGPDEYNLVGLRSVELSRRPDTPFVGRESELSTLLSYWERCRDRCQRHVVGLVGEAGIGKTRLMQAFKQAVQPVRWIGASCPSYLSSEPFALLRALLRQGLGLDADAPADAWRQKIVRFLGNETDAGAGRFDPALLEQVLGLRPSSAEDRDVAEGVRRAQLVAVLKVLLSQAAAAGPVILAIDDIYRADEASLDILNQLVDSLDQVPVFCLALYRREWLPPWANKRRCHTLDLDELAPADQAHLLTALLPPGLPDSTHPAVLARAGGNPLYLEELARAVGEGGGTAALPGTLRLTVLARAARLSPTARNVLDLAAVASSPFNLGLLDAALSQTGDAASLEPTLRTLVEHDFLHPTDRDYAFRHPLVEEVIYASLADAQRQTWHRRLADALSDRGDVSAAIVAWHRWRSVAAPDEHGTWVVHPPPFGPDYPAEAVRALVAAGEGARSQHANREAVRWFELGLEILDHLLPSSTLAQAACHAGAGRAFSRLGEFDAAVAHLEAAFELRHSQPETSGDLVESADLARLIGRMRMRQGEYAAALEWMARARKLVAGQDGIAARVLLALIEVHTGAVHHWRGDTEQAMAHYRAGIDLAEREGDDPIPALAEAYNGLGVALRGQGQLDAAQACYERALSIWQALGEAYEAARVQDNLGTVHFYRDDWETARECYERSLAFWERIEERHHIPYSLLNLGSIHLNQGRWGEARQCFARALELWEVVGEARMPALAHVNLAHLALAQADNAAASTHLDRALDILDRQGVDSFRAEVYATYAELHLQENDVEGTLMWGERAVETARKLDQPLEEGIAHRLLGQAHHRLRALPEALDQLQRSRELLTSVSNRLELARTWVTLAAIERELGQAEASQGHVERAIAAFQALGAQPDLARARSLGDLPDAGGRAMDPI